MSTVLQPARFGAGGALPWADALRGATASLELVPTDRTMGSERMDVHRWTADADEADLAALEGLSGPLLDIGCGPGRMVRAALDAGLQAYGLDAEPAAAQAARDAGLPVLQRDVFDPLPLTGAWASLLLLDGNIGIGGDVTALLARCGELLRRGGLLVVEAHPDPTRDAAALWRLRGADGGESSPFPWSLAGLPAVLRAAHDFALDRVWERDGRWFVRLRAL